jgi:hypothetical protein
MNGVGSWKVTLVAPMATQEMLLRILSQSENFTGIIESAMGNMNIAGTAVGNRLQWVMDVKKPMRIKVTCEVVVEGDTLSGTAKLGIFGKAKMTGTRVAGDLPATIGPDDDSAAPQSASAGDAQLVDAGSVDPQFNRPYVELSEWREHPVPHRYVRGGFQGTDARFSFYFPPKEKYQGRFFHNTYPLTVSSDIGPFPIQFDVAIGNLGFTVDSGAYYVQTNLGGADRMPPADPAIAAYRVNAAAAKYSRTLAGELYGPHRPYGYLFGGSGGSYQTIGSAENTRGVWDGFLPFVMATPNAIPSMFTVRMHALRILKRRNKFVAIMDAIDPGGSGDHLAELNDEERSALTEATSLGFPPRGWWNHATLTSGYFSDVAPLIPMLDPSYVDDFWTQPGYLGTDPKSTIRSEQFRFDTRVATVSDGFPKQLALDSVPDRDFANAHLVILSGAAAGKSVPIASVHGRTVAFAFAADHAVLNVIRAGDRARIDNAWSLALQTYQRHQVPTADLYGWNQYRDENGEPIYPQREILVGPIAAAGTAGSAPNGQINGKMLVLEALMDIDAMPWQADWYRSQVREALGTGFEDHFALWYIDHAQHDNPLTAAAHARTVSFEGALQQGLRDLSAWVERGIKPADTRYSIADAQVRVPDKAHDRGGVQPVVALQANGGVRAEVSVDETVAFTATIEVPPGAGKVVAAEWDFAGVGNYPINARIDKPATLVSLSATFAFAKPGTYFPVLRATSQRQGDMKTLYGRIQNLGRVRVVVR